MSYWQNSRGMKKAASEHWIHVWPLTYCLSFSPTYSSSIQELKERIRQRTNLPLGSSIDTHGETFLSQDIVVNLLQETRRAFERCHKVSYESTPPTQMNTISHEALGSCHFSFHLPSSSCLILQISPGMPSVFLYSLWITCVWITWTMHWKSAYQVVTYVWASRGNVQLTWKCITLLNYTYIHQRSQGS